MPPSPPAIAHSLRGVWLQPHGKDPAPESARAMQTPPWAQTQPNQAGHLALACPTHLGPSPDRLAEPGALGSRGSSTAMSRAWVFQLEMTHKRQEKPP